MYRLSGRYQHLMDSSKDLSRFTDEKLAIECPESDDFDPEGRDIAKGVPNVLVRV